MGITLHLPLRITLTALILIGGVFPAAIKDDHQAPLTDIQSLPKNESIVPPTSKVNISEHQQNSTNDKLVTSDKRPGGELNANATEAPESATKSASIEPNKVDASLNKTETDASGKVKEKDSIESTKVPTIDEKTINETHIEKKKSSDNSTSGEQLDLLTSFVTPHDNDETTVTEYTQKAESHEETTVVPIASDEKDHEATTPKINQTTLNSAPDETIHLTNDSIEASHKDELNDTSQTESSSSSTASTLIQHTATVQLESRTKLDEHGENGLPATITALIIAITFAVALGIAYISVIAWRRYLDYRYGHRELLVNDLEFDTNDLRHFEL